MSFRLVPKSVTLNDLELNLVNLRSNTQPRRTVAEFMHESIASCSTRSMLMSFLLTLYGILCTNAC